MIVGGGTLGVVCAAVCVGAPGVELDVVGRVVRVVVRDVARAGVAGVVGALSLGGRVVVVCRSAAMRRQAARVGNGPARAASCVVVCGGSCVVRASVDRASWAAWEARAIRASAATPAADGALVPRSPSSAALIPKWLSHSCAVGCPPRISAHWALACVASGWRCECGRVVVWARPRFRCELVRRRLLRF